MESEAEGFARALRTVALLRLRTCRDNGCSSLVLLVQKEARSYVL